MADLTYVDVRFSKTKRAPLTSQEYQEVPTVPPVCNFLSRALVAVVLLLLALVIVLTILTHRFSTQIHSKPKMPAAPYGNTTRDICPTSGFTFHSTLLTLEELKDHLCGEFNESMCVICPYKWLSFRQKCYFISEQLESWNFSNLYCQSRHAKLLIIDDKNEKDFIDGKEIGRSYFWIGMKYNKRNSEWTWLNGSTLQKGSIPMRSGEPGNFCGSYSNQEIFPLYCNNKAKWICEKEAIQFDKRCFSSSSYPQDQS
ncbi:natural killer cells antigen CD94-like isoform X2 [Lissotriton helveticus]